MDREQNISNLAPIAIEQIAFGVRFQPRYELLDSVGKIVDRILRTKGSPFDSNTFPYSSRDASEHRLINPTTGDNLRLTDSDAILEMQLKSRKTSDVKVLAENYSTYILDSLREVIRLQDIIRYGVLFRLEECHSAITVSPVDHFLQNDFKDARSLSLRFTRRLPVLEALARKNVDDYRNVIYTVKQSEDGDVKVWVDYQEIFNPQLDYKEWAKKPFADFVDRGISYFHGEFQTWLKKLIGKHEAA